MIRFDDRRIYLSADLLRTTVPELYRTFLRHRSGEIKEIDLTEVDRIDHAGVVFLETLRDSQESPPRYVGGNERVRRLLSLFGSEASDVPPAARREGVLERLGGQILDLWSAVGAYIRLASDVVFWTLAAPFDRGSRRRGAIAHQCDTIGVKAIPIVVFLSLIIGVIVVLQSAAQLRRFGATIFVADLLGLSITRETGPLFTAIILAGRSGSAIAAQVSSMRVSEELDALTVMALDPVRYVIVPMMAAMLLTAPLLTGLSMIVGIGGGVFVVAMNFDLTVAAFVARTFEIIGPLDLFIGLAKSVFFGAAIVITGSYFGLAARRDSEAVGRATTASVVVSISGVIALNAIFSLLYLI